MAQAFGPFLGVAQKPHPSHIKNEWLQYAEDVDFSRSTLAPMRTDRLLTASTGNTIYADSCCLKTYPECLNIAIDPFGCERVFVSGLPVGGEETPLTATPDKWCAGESVRMGWPCTFQAPTVVYTGAATTDRISEGRAYVYTFTNIFGEESQSSLPSALTIIDYNIPALISGFAAPPVPYGAEFLNIYVSVAGMSHLVGGGSEGNDEFLKIATLPVGTLMFSHDPLVHFLGEALTTDEFNPVPQDARDFQHWGTSQLAFQSQGSLRFTEPYNYSLAPLKYTYTPKAPLLRVMATQEFIYLLTCSQPEVVTSKGACDMSGSRESKVVNDAFPLIGRQSPAVFESSIIFASTTGLIQLTGPNAVVITDEVFTQEQWDNLQPHTIRGIVHDGYYYGASDTCTFRLEMARGPKSGSAEKFSYLSIRPTAWVTTTDARLLYADASGVHEVGQGDNFKNYKAVTRDVYEQGQSAHTAFRIQASPGAVTIKQTVITNEGAEFDDTCTVNHGGSYRFKRKLAAGSRYTITGTTEVSAFVIGNSIQGVTGKA